MTLNLITDRTLADVNRANYLYEKIHRDGMTGLTPQEVTEWFSEMKGRYDLTDLNRVETAVRFLDALLLESGYLTRTTTRINWGMSDVRTEAEMFRYLDNVRRIIRRFVVLPTTPSLPANMNNLNHNMANAIEQTLEDVHFLILQMLQNELFTNEISCGEEDWV